MNGRFRPAKAVEWNVRDTSTVLLDDALYPQAISFLSSLLYSRDSHKALIPFPQQLALLSTIIVHPLFTNRAPNEERSEASNTALRLLYDVTRIVGPVNAECTNAFAFTSLRASRSHSRKRAAPVDSDSEDSDERFDRDLSSKYSRSESVWTQADDLWHIVGWSFNCSVKHRKRWQRWKLWLQWLVSTMETDWKERMRLAKDVIETDKLAAKETMLGCMIMQYVKCIEGRNGRRRIARAVLADGSQKSSNEFPEVWKDETKERKKKSDGFEKPKKKINLDEGEFGDYEWDEDEDEVMEDAGDEEGDVTLTPGSDDSDSRKSRQEPDPFLLGIKQLGGVDAVNLRRRLLALLFELARELPHYFTDAEDLLDLYTEFMRSLSLSHFCALLPNGGIKPESYVSLLANHLIPLIGAPIPRGGIFEVTQDQLVQDFISHAANSNSAVDNAKVSLVLESLFMAMMDCNRIEPTEKFGAAVEEGIRARKAKAIGDARRKGKGTTGEESEAKKVLELSSERLMALLEIIERDAGIEHNRFPNSEPPSSLSELSTTPVEFSEEEEDTE